MTGQGGLETEQGRPLFPGLAPARVSLEVLWADEPGDVGQINPHPASAAHSPCSLEISGLYQYLEVSCTNLTFARVSGLLSGVGHGEKNQATQQETCSPPPQGSLNLPGITLETFLNRGTAQTPSPGSSPPSIRNAAEISRAHELTPAWSGAVSILPARWDRRGHDTACKPGDFGGQLRASRSRQSSRSRETGVPSTPKAGKPPQLGDETEGTSGGLQWGTSRSPTPSACCFPVFCWLLRGRQLGEEKLQPGP